ncbi:MAG: selenocysteine-specific translation elongation factor [bacterium]
MAQSHFIIGTAGHIDHGKTALVKALTGIDTDRLKEEQDRGLTIDLGFAHFGDQTTIIDVPGHEKFIRNMVAGVSTIDIVLFVIAADDGIMPQTREHLDILKILQIKHGIIVLTKIDLVEEDWLELVKEELAGLVKDSFLENASVAPVSSVTAAGIPELKKVLEKRLSELRRSGERGVFWMPVDRSFTMKGFGTVVTGSVLSGEARVGGTLELLPQKKIVKIRGLQSRKQSVSEVGAGDRAAVNLQAIEKQQIRRGDVLAVANYFSPSQRFAARLDLLKSAPHIIKPNTRVRLHFGTTEVMARVSIFSKNRIEPGTSAYVLFHLERPAIARRLDPFVIRQFSPTLTIGGGVILDANSPRRKLSDPASLQLLHTLEKENPAQVLEEKILTAGYTLSTLESLAADIASPIERVERLAGDLQKAGKLTLIRKDGKKAALHVENLNSLTENVQSTLEQFHKNNPAKIGLNKSEIPKVLKTKIDREVLDYVVNALKERHVLKVTSGLLSLTEHEFALNDELKPLHEKIEKSLYEEKYSTSSSEQLAKKINAQIGDIDDVLAYMVSVKEIVRVEGNLYFHTLQLEKAREKLVSYLKKNHEISVSQFKELLGGTSRKYALPLLIYFDTLGVTERVGEVRILGLQ